MLHYVYLEIHLKYIWSSKDQNKEFDIKWSVFKKSSEYSIVSKLSNLYLLEELIICNFREKDRLLNVRYLIRYCVEV